MSRPRLNPKSSLETARRRLFARLFGSTLLRRVRFRRFYLGSTGTALGVTMQATVAAWLMTTLTPSVFMVALVQTANTVPSLLFGFMAGALADIVDRRRVVLVAQAVLFLSTLILAIATLVGVINPPAVLVLSFLIGAGFTFYIPAQQSLLNDLVPRTELPSAVALISVSFNAARAAGPALAGALAGLLGLGYALLLAAASFSAMLFSLRDWPAARYVATGIPETIVSGVRSGLRYTRHSPTLRALVIRNLTFSSCASALWALFPVIAREQLGLGASGFGLLFGCFGAGAIVGSLNLPRLLRRISLNTLVNTGVLIWVVGTLLIATVPILAVAVAGTFAAGFAWVSVHASLSAGTQTSAPAWVRARAVSMSWVALQTSLALGSVAWGALASVSGTRVALATSAGVALLLMVLNRRVRVTLGHESEVTAGSSLPDLTVAGEPMPDDGPVLIQVEYRIAPSNRDAFLNAIHALEPIRRRNGASNWLVFRDLEDDEHFIERFVVESWAEYTRLRARRTVSDEEIQACVQQLQTGDAEVRISRFIRVGPSPAEPDDLTGQ